MPDHFSRVEKVLKSMHPAADYVGAVETHLPTIVLGVTYQYRTPDRQDVFGWISGNEKGEESVLISNSPPGATKAACA